MPDRFKISKVLADNGTSRLVRAVDQQTNQKVVVRIHQAATEDERKALEILLNSVAELRHPRIEPIHWVARDGERIAAMTEQIQGDTISQMVACGPLAVPEFLTVASQALEGLSAAHERGIVHGALNSERIVVRKETDGSLNAFVTGYGVGFGAASKTGDVTAFLCVPPEQWEQQAARRRSDVYSVGCVFYQSLAGRHPFESKTLKELRHKHLNHDVRPLDQLAPQAPKWLCRWVMSLLAASPDARFATAAAALQALKTAESSGDAAAAPAPGPAPAASLPQPSPTTFVPAMMPAAYAVPQPLTTTVQVPPQQAASRPNLPGPKKPAGPRSHRPAKAQAHPGPGNTAWFARFKWPIIGGIAAALVIGFIMARKPAAPIKVTSTAPGTIKVQGNAPKPSPAPKSPMASASSNDLPELKRPYPSGRGKPPNHGQLVFHAMSEGDILGDRTDGKGQRLPAVEGGKVTAWRDYAERARDSTLSHPGQGSVFPSLVTMRPDAAFPLTRDKRFIRFPGEGSPPPALSSSPKNQAKDFPFGHGQPADRRGLAFAAIFHQEVRGHEQTLLHLSGPGGSAALRLGGKGDIRFSVRRPGIPEGEQTPALIIPADQFNPWEPLLVIGMWKSNPAEASLRLRSASGVSLQAPAVKAGAPGDHLGNTLIGRDPLPGPGSSNKNTDAQSLKAFCGGVADVLIYSSALNENDLKSLESHLGGLYFPKK